MGSAYILRADGSPRIDADLLWLPFATRLFGLLSACADEGQAYFATFGFRSYSESKAMHLRYKAGGPRAAAPGTSGHNFGIACDVSPDADPKRPGLQPEITIARYAVLARLAPRFGLTTGASYADHPHVEIPGLVSARELAQLRAVYESTSGDAPTRLRAVWARLDAQPPAAWNAAA